MAFLVSSAACDRFAAILQVRWQMLRNSLRTPHGRVDLGANLLQNGFFLVIWLGIGMGVGFASWDFTLHGSIQKLSLLLWPVLLAWQTLPFLLAASRRTIDLGFLLRFPVSFRFYSALYIFFGLFDLSSIMGGVALLGMWTAITTARTDLALWAAFILVLFAAFNLLLAQTISAWVSRWFARRKTKEILAILFLFIFLGLQFLNPVLHPNGWEEHFPHSPIGLSAEAIGHLQKLFPPSLAADSLATFAAGSALQSVMPVLWIMLYTLVVAALLGFRLRSEWNGEQLSQGTERRQKQHKFRRHFPNGWFWFQMPGALGAILDKEVRTLRRSGALLYNLAAPPILVLLFGSLPQSGGGHNAEYALPLGAAYGFLGLTRLVNNSLGGEAAGIQIYLLSPTSIRTVMLGKNLLQAELLGVEMALITAIVWLRFGMPGPFIMTATFCWLLFALPLQLALGNVLSIYMAYRMTLTHLSREPGSVSNALMALAVQGIAVGIGMGLFFGLSSVGLTEWSIPIFLILSFCAIFGWLYSLSKVDRMMEKRRETLLATLVRA